MIALADEKREKVLSLVVMGVAGAVWVALVVLALV